MIQTRLCVLLSCPIVLLYAESEYCLEYNFSINSVKVYRYRSVVWMCNVDLRAKARARCSERQYVETRASEIFLQIERDISERN